MKSSLPKEILNKAKTITGKRARIVVEHIIKHESITTEDIQKYGYEHPPRAVRDVIEQGLPLERSWTKNSAGRKIAEYRFGNLSAIRNDRLGGRTVFSKEFKLQVIGATSSCCTICCTKFAPRYLQIDHRIPYQVAGEGSSKLKNKQDYMPLCGSCNRAKSWSCENCLNSTTIHNKTICQTCYWANPQHYSHVAMREIRRLDIVWEGLEIQEHDELIKQALLKKEPLPKFVKDILKKSLKP